MEAIKPPRLNESAPCGRKKRLARVLHAVGVPSLARRVRPLRGREVTVLAYHRVLDIADEKTFRFDPELVSVSVADFEWQMTYLGRHHDPISFAQLLDALDEKSRLPPRPVIVSFDDGFDDNYRLAFPILKSLGIPATFFLATDYIGQPHTLWFDWLVYLCKQARAAGVRLPMPGEPFSFDESDSADGMARVMRRVFTLPDDERRHLIRSFEDVLNMQHPASGFDESRPMTWEQVQEMAQAGFEFGSHTASHPILTQVGDAALRRELSVSKRILEERLGRSIDVLAYPVGLFDERVRQQTEEAGYRLGISYTSGVNHLKTLDRFGVKRLHVERYVDRHEFAMSLALPGLFA